MADPYPLRPVQAEEFDAYYAVDAHAFHNGPLTPRKREQRLRQFEADRSLGAFDGDEPVGIAGIYSFQMAVPGAVVPAAGVTWVAVLPTHRRQGIMTSLMHRQLRDVRDRGETFAVLWSSESALYGRFGYGPASWQASFQLGRGDGAPARRGPAREPGLRVRIAGPEAARAELGKVYETVLPTRPGMFARDALWWNRVLSSNDDGLSGGDPVRCVIAEDSSGPRGYAIYTARNQWDEAGLLPDSKLNVSELVADSPAATAALWADLLTRDLTTEFVALLRPADDPLPHLLADPRRARRTVGDALWVRLTDLPRALAQRRYASPADVTIEVTDALFPEHRGRWRLRTQAQAARVSGGPGLAATCEPAGDSTDASGAGADLTLDVSALGAAYLGGTALANLAEAGQVTEHRPGALLTLSTAMSWHPSPWCPVIF